MVLGVWGRHLFLSEGCKPEYWFRGCGGGTFFCVSVRPSHPLRPSNLFALYSLPIIQASRTRCYALRPRPTAAQHTYVLLRYSLAPAACCLKPAGAAISHFSQVVQYSTTSLCLDPIRPPQSTATARTYLRNNASTPYCML